MNTKFMGNSLENTRLAHAKKAIKNLTGLASHPSSQLCMAL
jgi:hypothetical protein